MMRAAILVCVALAVGVGAMWLLDGKHLGTLTEKPVEQIVTDEFGDEEKVIKWQPTFELGLDIAGPVGAVLLGIAGTLVIVQRRRRQAVIE